MDKGSSYIRRKRKEENFTRLPNSMLRDKRLSWKARGLLAYMLSMPDDWVFYDSELVSHSKKDGITTLRTAVKELKEFGYLKKEPLRDELGKVVKWVTYIDDEPIQNTENLECGKPTMWENHNVENQTLLTTNSLLTNDDIQTNNNNSSSAKPTKQVIKYDESSPYYGMAKYLYEKMLTNNPKAKEPNYQVWADDFRKIIELDERDALDVKSIIDFSQNDSFWCSNILSPAKLRKQYDQLLIKMNQPKQQFNRGGYKQNEGFKRADDVDSFKERFGVDAPF